MSFVSSLLLNFYTASTPHYLHICNSTSISLGRMAGGKGGVNYTLVQPYEYKIIKNYLRNLEGYRTVV